MKSNAAIRSVNTSASTKRTGSDVRRGLLIEQVYQYFSDCPDFIDWHHHYNRTLKLQL